MDKLIENYKKVLKDYSNFSGRAGRAEFWNFFLANFIIMLVLSIISKIIGDETNTLSSIYNLFVLLPGLAVGIRRLHDVGKSGWMMLVSLIPIVGAIWILILEIKVGDPNENEYGPAVSATKTE